MNNNYQSYNDSPNNEENDKTNSYTNKSPTKCEPPNLILSNKYNKKTRRNNPVLKFVNGAKKPKTNANYNQEQKEISIEWKPFPKNSCKGRQTRIPNYRNTNTSNSCNNSVRNKITNSKSKKLNMPISLTHFIDQEKEIEELIKQETDQIKNIRKRNIDNIDIINKEKLEIMALIESINELQCESNEKISVTQIKVSNNKNKEESLNQLINNTQGSIQTQIKIKTKLIDLNNFKLNEIEEYKSLVILII